MMFRMSRTGPQQSQLRRVADGALDAESVPAGVLVVNADDWGRDRETTERTLDCLRCGSVSSVSAMVFMEDSDRAAGVARQHGVDAGLHLNLTTPFSGRVVSTALLDHQVRVSRFLRRHRFAPILLHPGLTRSFEYVVRTQLDEFHRLYGPGAHRIDGHHHMHLCANVVLAGLLPPGGVVRRNFSFRAGEKSGWNRLYRTVIDRLLARRHHLVDCLFALPPMEGERLQRIFSAARHYVVELEVHPVQPEEYRFLMGGDLFRWAGETPILPFASAPLPRRHSARATGAGVTGAIGRRR